LNNLIATTEALNQDTNVKNTIIIFEQNKITVILLIIELSKKIKYNLDAKIMILQILPLVLYGKCGSGIVKIKQCKKSV